MNIKIKIKMVTFEDIQKFVEICSAYPDDIDVKSGHFVINGKSLMGLLSLDYSKEVFAEIHTEKAESEDTNKLVDALARFTIHA